MRLVKPRSMNGMSVARQPRPMNGMLVAITVMN